MSDVPSYNSATTSDIPMTQPGGLLNNLRVVELAGLAPGCTSTDTNDKYINDRQHRLLVSSSLISVPASFASIVL